LDCIDPTKCNSNNPWEIYEIFGVEAAFQFLIHEFKKVSSKVSRRHLDVMVEWMCTSGKLSSVNRYGQDISKIGPMAKASFEKPLEAFVKAASSAQTEVITGVSASISTGNLARIGTGSFQMMLDMQKLMSSTPIEEEKKLMISEDQEIEEEFEDMFTGTDEQPDDFTYQMGDDDDGLI
jgi:DNA-directed RNA polymerase II subunit RPB1